MKKETGAIESSEELPPLRRAGEIAAFGLRMNAGWPFEEFQRTTQFDLRNEWAAEMNQLAERGWAARDSQPFSSHRTKDCALPIRRRKCFCGDSSQR